jgi:hypothetical protein
VLAVVSLWSWPTHGFWACCICGCWVRLRAVDMVVMVKGDGKRPMSGNRGRAVGR